MSEKVIPKISVVMAVRDGGQYLKEAIGSILNQTYSDFEFIIIDDGSTDGSREVVARHAAEDLRITPLYFEHQGLTQSLNYGLREARGKYIARMDADDISLPERIEKEYDYLEAHPDIALVSCFARVIDDEGVVIGQHAPPVSHQSILRRSFFAGQICHPAVMFRTEVVRALGGYDAAFRYAQDYELWLRLMEHYTVVTIPSYLFLWRASSLGIGRAKRAEQRRYAQRARITAIHRGLYPRWYYLLLCIPYIQDYIPRGVKDFIKKFV